jgi:hypothetical protein
MVLYISIIYAGDSGYGLKEWLMTPLSNDPEDPAEQAYNRSHKSTRRIVECAYGILKERFPCLQHLRVKPEYAGLVVLACVTLHNIANKEDFDYEFPDTGLDGGFGAQPEPGDREIETETGKDRRNEFLAYFA